MSEPDGPSPPLLGRHRSGGGAGYRRVVGAHRANGAPAPTRGYLFTVALLAGTASMPILAAISTGSATVGGTALPNGSTPFIPTPSRGPVVVGPSGPVAPTAVRSTPGPSATAVHPAAVRATGRPAGRPVVVPSTGSPPVRPTPSPTPSPTRPHPPSPLPSSGSQVDPGPVLPSPTAGPSGPPPTPTPTPNPTLSELPTVGPLPLPASPTTSPIHQPWSPLHPPWHRPNR